MLTRHRLGCFCTHHSLGGRIRPPPLLSRKRMDVERRTRRHSKDLDETLPNHVRKFKIEVTCQVKVRSKVKIGCFQVADCSDLKRSMFRPKLSICRRPGTGHTPGPGYCRLSGDAGRRPTSDRMVDVYREVTIQAEHGWWWWGAGHQVAVQAPEPLICGPGTCQSVSGPAHCYGVEQTCGDQTTLQSGRRTSCRGDRSGIAPIAFGSAVSQASAGLPERVPNMPV